MNHDVRTVVETAAAQPRMTREPEQAIAFLDELIEEFEARRDALKADMERGS